MATYSKRILSGSANGKQIKVTGTATASSVLIHKAVAGSSSVDEVWVYATNNQVAAVDLTIEWGEVTVPDGNIQVSIPGLSGLFLVIPGLVIQAELDVRAFASVANVVCLSGYVNRIDV